MRMKLLNSSGAAGAVLAAGLALGLAVSAPTRAHAAPMSAQPGELVTLSVGRGQLVRLASPMSDLFVADPNVADVQVRSTSQLYVFGKGPGETTVYATDKSGKVVYSANVRVGSNFSSVGSMLKIAMPDAAITATPMNGIVLLTGTVAAPGDVEEAQRLVQAFVGEKTQVISRLKTATPMQVNLQVKIAEVNRALVKEIGTNLLSRDNTGGFLFGVGRGNPGTIGNIDTSAFPKIDASSVYGLPAGTLSLPFDPTTGKFITGGTDFKFAAPPSGKTALRFAGKLLGLDLLASLDLAETDGLVTTLAEPNLTALSGETASFLAGGEFPIPLSQSLGQVTIEYKQYGVSLAFTPTVLADGRISMRVRPEVSELSNEGAIELNNFTVPGITTRRAETTVELGSGQSFMIGGLLRNKHTNGIDKAPGLGDIPILGALFRSTKYQRAETELVIVVTPYLVKPVSANQIRLPTDGYRAATDVERLLGGQNWSGKSGGERPMPRMAPPVTAPAPLPGPFSDAGSAKKPKKSKKSEEGTSAAPGFSLK